MERFAKPSTNLKTASFNGNLFLFQLLSKTSQNICVYQLQYRVAKINFFFLIETEIAEDHGVVAYVLLTSLNLASFFPFKQVGRKK